MQDLLIELLQVSLGCRRHLSRVPSNKAWHAVFEEAQRQAIAGVLVNGLEQLPEEERPYQDLLLQWIGIAQINESTYALHQKRAKQVTSFFHSAGYSTVILKGLSSAFRYTKPEHRECGDIDIWIPSVMTGESKKGRCNAAAQKKI